MSAENAGQDSGRTWIEKQYKCDLSDAKLLLR
jgi:hypothetical protein